MADRYHRGTPHGAMTLKWRIIVLLLIITFSAVLATFSTAIVAGNDYWPVALQLSALGAIAGICALLLNLSMYALSLWIVILVACVASPIQHDGAPPVLERIMMSMKNTLPLLVVVFVSLVNPAIFATASAIPPSLLLLLMAVPVLSFTVAYAMLIQTDSYTHTTSIPALICTLLVSLLVAWYRNRTHKCLNLLQPHEQGMALCTAVAMSMSLQQSQAHTEMLIYAMTGLTLCTLMCSSMAAAADVWYAIGTGQFWMISLDFSVGASFLVIPFSILTFRFLGIYGEQFLAVLKLATAGVSDVQIPATPIDLAESSLLLWMGLLSTLGIIITRAWSPFGAYFYGRVFFHGMQHSKNVAVCVAWSDGAKDLFPKLAELKAKINILVTNQEMLQDGDALKDAIKAGHAVVPLTSEPKSRQTYENVFGITPEWAHGAASSPSQTLLWKDTKVALWTNYYQKSVNMEELRTDLSVMGGGAIIHLVQIPNVVEVFQGIRSFNYNLTTLTVTVPEPLQMILTAETED